MKQKQREVLENNKDKKRIWQFSILEYFSYGIIFLIPLYRNYNHWMPISMPKQLLFIGTLCAMLIFYIWGKWKNSDNRFVFTQIHIGLAVFLGILTLSALFGVDPKNSFFGPLQSNLSLIVLYFLGILGLFIGFLIKRNESFLPRLATVAIVSGVITAGITYFGKDVIRLSNDGSTVGNNSYLGAYLLLIVCMSIGIFFWYKKVWQKLLIGLGVITIIISPVFLNRVIWTGDVGFSQIIDNPTLLLGAANGAAIGLGVAIIVMVFLFLTRTKKTMVRVLGGICLAGLIIGIWIGGSIFMNPESGLHKAFVAEKTENRFIFWDAARDGFVERPLLGYGLNNYAYMYQKYLTDRIFRNDRGLELWVSRPHNIFWEYLSLSGIFGLLAFAASIGGLFIFFYKKSADEDRIKKIFGVVFAGAVFGYTLQNLFVFDTLVPLVFFFVIVGTAIGFSKEYYTPHMGNIFKKVLLGTGGVLCGVIFVILVILPWHESIRWGKIAGDVSISKLAELRKGAQDISLIGSIEDAALITDREIQRINAVIPTLTVKTKPIVLAEIDSLIANLEREIVRSPNSYRAHLAVGNLSTLRLIIVQENENTTISNAVDHFNKAALLSPANPMTYINLANMYAVVGDSSKTYKYLRAGIAIGPTYVDGYAAARTILKILPNQEFEKYLTTMEKRWLVEFGAN